MKTKILKFGMPLMAFLLAIVFAFASNEKPTATNDVVVGYITSMCTPIEHSCQDNGNELCTVDFETVYKNGCIKAWTRL